MSIATIDIGAIARGIDGVESRLTNEGASIEAEIQKGLSAVQLVADSWSQSPFVSHCDLYYGNFQRPTPYDAFDMDWGLIHGLPEGWAQKREAEVFSEIERLHGGVGLKELELNVSEIASQSESLRDEVLTKLSAYEGKPEFASELKMGKDLEVLDFSPAPGKYAGRGLARTRVTRDANAISSGLKAPYHAWYKARLEVAVETLAACRELVKRARRILGQLEVKGAISAGEKSLDAVATVTALLKKFHQVARQLRVRHGNRPTLEISDEYDVQDLLHALLRARFDDIRPEEWTPGYAGGSSRMDFLLKDERIVIEAKKTRQGLSDREIGDQLIIDIARYKASPDCSTLICFVYDPEGKVRNPRGLSGDLEALSTPELAVLVFIEPSF